MFKHLIQENKNEHKFKEEEYALKRPSRIRFNLTRPGFAMREKDNRFGDSDTSSPSADSALSLKLDGWPSSCLPVDLMKSKTTSA